MGNFIKRSARLAKNNSWLVALAVTVIFGIRSWLLNPSPPRIEFTELLCQDLLSPILTGPTMPIRVEWDTSLGAPQPHYIHLRHLVISLYEIRNAGGRSFDWTKHLPISLRVPSQGHVLGVVPKVISELTDPRVRVESDRASIAVWAEGILNPNDSFQVAVFHDSGSACSLEIEGKFPDQPLPRIIHLEGKEATKTARNWCVGYIMVAAFLCNLIPWFRKKHTASLRLVSTILVFGVGVLLSWHFMAAFDVSGSAVVVALYVLIPYFAAIFFFSLLIVPASQAMVNYYRSARGQS